MRLLILGGTIFLGRHVVDAALAAGHEVTTFTRGRSGAPPDGVEALHGDRDGGLDALRGREWDAVIDTSGYVPRIVDAGAELLADAAGHYVFVSSCSAYAGHGEPGMDEGAPLGELPADHGEDVGTYYGELKAACERVVEACFPGRALNVRSGLLVGPHDPTGRFTSWVLRGARGDELLAPAPADQPFQVVDARDMAAWLVAAAQARVSGAMNATGEVAPLSELVRACATEGTRVTWVDEAFLLEQGVEPWTELTVWIAPAANRDLRGFLALDVSRAIGAGLRFRPLAETVRDTLAWARATAEPGPLRPAPERERALLDAWRAQRGDGS
jgi:2'-hydroxyisoflavone reductase